LRRDRQSRTYSVMTALAPERSSSSAKAFGCGRIGSYTVMRDRRETGWSKVQGDSPSALAHRNVLRSTKVVSTARGWFLKHRCNANVPSVNTSLVPTYETTRKDDHTTPSNKPVYETRTRSGSTTVKKPGVRDSSKGRPNYTVMNLFYEHALKVITLHGSNDPVTEGRVQKSDHYLSTNQCYETRQSTTNYTVDGPRFTKNSHTGPINYTGLQNTVSETQKVRYRNYTCPAS